MRVYLAASYSRRAEMASHAEVLRAAGLEVTSRWIDGSHELDDVATEKDRARLAQEDVEDLAHRGRDPRRGWQVSEWTRSLQRLGACSEAVAWARGYPSLKAAWAACERGDWLLWICGRVSGEPWSEGRQALVLAACECARLVLPVWEKNYPKDRRPHKAIETAEAWARGDATRAQVTDAADAASAAADAAYAAASAASAAHAADADFSAVFAAYAAAYAADAAFSAASASAAASAAASASAASRASTLKACADIVRRHYPAPPQYCAWCEAVTEERARCAKIAQGYGDGAPDASKAERRRRAGGSPRSSRGKG